ncbi:MAG: hypothetical protein R3A48_04285 [Polyangiales bacterium]
MTKIRSLSRALALSLPLGLALGGVANAGTLQVRDEASLLTPADVSALRAQVEAQPFDVRVWTTRSGTDRAAFDARVGRLVASPRMVVIAVDPVHRRTSVHFGLSTGVAAERYQAIRDAGATSFRTSEWRGGLSAIVRATGESATMRPARGARSTGFPWALVLLGVGTIAGVALLVRFVRGRAQQMGGYPGSNPNAPGYYDPNAGHGGMNYGPGYGPNYGPGYGPNYGPGYGPSGGSGLGAGLVGAGLGGLAGYAIGRSMSNTESHGAEHGSFGSSHDAGGGDFDAGGGASDWGDSGGGDGGGDW